MCSNSSKGPMDNLKSEDVVNAGGAEDGSQRDLIVSRERRFLQYPVEPDDHEYDKNQEINDQSYCNEDRSTPLRKKPKVHNDISGDTYEHDDCVEKETLSKMSSNSTKYASKNAASSHDKVSDEKANKGSERSKLSLIANLIDSRGKQDHFEHKNDNEECEEDQIESSTAPKTGEYEIHDQDENVASYDRIEKNSLEPTHDSKMMRSEDNDGTARNKLNSTHLGRTNDSGILKTLTEGLYRDSPSVYKSSAPQRHSSQSSHSSKTKKTSFRFPVKVRLIFIQFDRNI